MIRKTLASLALLALVPSRPAWGDPAAAEPARVKLVEVAPPDGGAEWVAATIASARRATLSTRLSATVRAVAVEEGAPVQRGALLVRLSDEDVRAGLAAARTALANATLQEKRISTLAAQRAATPSELEQAQAMRAQAEAQVAAARANLAYTEIRAPFDGTVQARRVNAGDLVGPGQPLVDIEGSELEVQATLSEAEAAPLRIGQTIQFTADGRTGTAEITALTTGGDPLSHRRFLRARVGGDAPGLRSGTFARIAVPGMKGARAATAWVPRTAVVERGDLTGVFVAANGRAELRWIALGEPAGDRYPVRAGLRPDERVIDAPGALRDGQPVEVASGR